MGQNLAELAILLPLLIAMIGLTLDMGRSLQAYIVLNNAAREAARYASINPANTSGITNAALAELQRGGLSSSNATVNKRGSGSGNPVQVTVTYQMPLVFGLLGSPQLTIQASAEAVIL